MSIKMKDKSFSTDIQTNLAYSFMAEVGIWEKAEIIKKAKKKRMKKRLERPQTVRRFMQSTLKEKPEETIDEKNIGVSLDTRANPPQVSTVGRSAGDKPPQRLLFLRFPFVSLWNLFGLRGITTDTKGSPSTTPFWQITPKQKPLEMTMRVTDQNAKTGFWRFCTWSPCGRRDSIMKRRLWLLIKLKAITIGRKCVNVMLAGLRKMTISVTQKRLNSIRLLFQNASEGIVIKS